MGEILILFKFDSIGELKSTIFLILGPQSQQFLVGLGVGLDWR
jgi:hypothetical protein